MEFDLTNSTALLARTPAVLNAWIRELPDVWVEAREGAETWSVREIVGHLIHGEKTDWIPRARRILEHGEAKAFDPFDRLGHLNEIAGRSPGQLLDEFAALRAGNLEQLRAMNPDAAALARRGLHPALGVVTLSELLATWVAHDLSHLHQISRVMAHQYREAVGPWAAYLGVLQCSGHSS